jgi:hypothetical protein
MEMPNDFFGKKRFTYVLEYSINWDKNNIGLCVICSMDKKQLKKAKKGIKLTNKYIDDMKKLGYVFENCVLEKVENEKD